MKSRASLVLMEQLIMILVFALAAALCLQVFAKADTIAQQTACQDEALRIAQNAAETLKHTCGNGQISVENDHFFLEIRQEETEIPNFSKATVSVSCDCGAAFTLTTGWQEVAP